MKILVLGGDGMLGHELFSGLSPMHEVRVTLRRELGAYAGLCGFDRSSAYDGVDVRRPEALTEVLADFRPEAIINAVGIVKQRAAAKDASRSIEVNALFPHRLATVARAAGARVVHVSTDCVFSGRKGSYTEEDETDPVDMYGTTKLLGELADEHCVTLRTSIIGLEVASRQGLVEWALYQQGVIKGFRRAIYSGLTTMELARVAETVLTRHPDLRGVWHVASEPITKHDLLVSLLERTGRSDVNVIPDDEVACDRSLCARAFADATGYRPPAWDTMLDELAGRISDRGRTGP